MKKKHALQKGRYLRSAIVIERTGTAAQVPSSNRFQKAGRFFLVSVRPGGQLWLAGVLEYPKFKDDAWIAAGANQVPITDISSIYSQLRFASGKGIQCEPGKLGMVLQTPRVLTDDDVLLLRSATGQIPKAASSKIKSPPSLKTTTNKSTKASPQPATIITPEKLKTLERLLRVSSRVKIDDLAAVLGTSRADLLLKLLDFADQYHFKIEEDVITFETDVVAGDFIKKLEKEFDVWSRSNEKRS